MDPVLDGKKAAAQARMPGWEAWYVVTVQQGIRWCGRPVGHPRGVCDAGSPDALVEQAKAWQKRATELTATIERTRVSIAAAELADRPWLEESLAQLQRELRQLHRGPVPIG